MRIVIGVVTLALLASACSKKEDAAKPAAQAPAAAAPGVPAEFAEGPRAGKWKMTTTMAMAPQAITAEVCLPKTSFKEMQAAQQQAGVTCTDQSFKRVGADIVTHAVCQYEGGMKATVDSKISGDINSRYTMETKTVMDPAPNPAMRETTMTIVAERLGDC